MAENEDIKVVEDQAQQPKNLEEKKERVDDRQQFMCSICGLCELTKYGRLEHKTISAHGEVFYILDPFVPYDIHKVDFRVSDFVIFGSKCSICQQPVCVSKACSLFYHSNYCLYCVEREQHRFPKEIINDLHKRFAQISKKDVPNTSKETLKEDVLTKTT
ncbi:unnamed protein product [Bursaphelenchus okinawaensis]|uniref:Cysteine-rich DPF motif domain-containing protein 1 n=1 Tax=Bursaphelenchus okinawaensis TaxID=465554 RepID=A0A811KTP3_9BILA|nr:unnamed protein product [Bursaphelenchus okinawaensis]CAG9111851.1 unnamed protein product [Bursaphelenchus okinawaensis]